MSEPENKPDWVEDASDDERADAARWDERNEAAR